MSDNGRAPEPWIVSWWKSLSTFARFMIVLGGPLLIAYALGSQGR